MFTSPAALYRADSPSLIHRAGLLRKQLVVRYGSTAPELAAVPNPKVFLDLSIGGGEPQRVTFEVCPLGPWYMPYCNDAVRLCAAFCADRPEDCWCAKFIHLVLEWVEANHGTHRKL
jgi:hypothetical protein